MDILKCLVNIYVWGEMDHIVLWLFKPSWVLEMEV